MQYNNFMRKILLVALAAIVTSPLSAHAEKPVSNETRDWVIFALKIQIMKSLEVDK